ncbi:WXG100 family type VII secretion target [Corynebacterium sp. HMSC073D01]|uniref:WXG100 family type VII secretion target n=1 Tax=Corynebacterium sp. HMSC073D01 TaxID=1739536 RepID=UPI0008A17E84|nr:WXG100 family type VII secretion target [Corynebacterium sp. HMSC073D01]OFO49568.1 secretion protein [Corynebacterium sp. HMSC073D01]
MESLIRYDFGAISAASADMRTTSGRINGLLGDLKSQIAPMVSTWKGDSAVAYQDAQNRWDRAAGELNQILETIARTVEDGNQRMSEMNSRAAASWS